jgi:hypothetical protein
MIGNELLACQAAVACTGTPRPALGEACGQGDDRCLLRNWLPPAQLSRVGAFPPIPDSTKVRSWSLDLARRIWAQGPNMPSAARRNERRLAGYPSGGSTDCYGSPAVFRRADGRTASLPVAPPQLGTVARVSPNPGTACGSECRRAWPPWSRSRMLAAGRPDSDRTAPNLS